MGVTKSSLFTEEQNQLAQMAKVVAHPARVAILQHLVKANKCINSDLVEELGLAQATISQHLKELKSVGFISGTVEGTSMCYCINGRVLESFKHQLAKAFKIEELNSGESCC